MLSNKNMLLPKGSICCPRGYIDAKEYYVLSTELFSFHRGICVTYSPYCFKRGRCATHEAMMCPKRDMCYLRVYISFLKRPT